MATLNAIKNGERVASFNAPPATTFALMEFIGPNSSPELQRMKEQYNRDFQTMQPKDFLSKWSGVAVNAPGVDAVRIPGDWVSGFRSNPDGARNLPDPGGNKSFSYACNSLWSIIFFDFLG